MPTGIKIGTADNESGCFLSVAVTLFVCANLSSLSANGLRTVRDCMGEGWGGPTEGPKPAARLGALALLTRGPAPRRRRGWDLPRPFGTGASDSEGSLNSLGGSDEGAAVLGNRSNAPPEFFGGLPGFVSGPLMVLGTLFSPPRSSRWKGGCRGARAVFLGAEVCEPSDDVLVPVEVVVGGGERGGGGKEEEEEGTTQ